MPDIHVYISKVDLKRIDEFCTAKGRTRSEILVKSALHFIPKPKCDGCSNKSEGRYEIFYWEWEKGDAIEQKYLCVKHLREARQKGEVKEI